MNDKKEMKLPYFELTREILRCCFEVMKELGPGFQESVYKNALLIAMREQKLQVEPEQSFEVVFRGRIIDKYRADLIVEKTVIVELKCCESLIREHQAQLFNYLKVSNLPVGLLVNFRRRKLEYKRLHGIDICDEPEQVDALELIPF
jgi:GxxExxY protein